LDDYFVNLCKFTLENGDQFRTFGILERIIGFSGAARPEISQMFADSLKADGQFSRAYKYYFRARDETNIIECLKKVMA
jgi:hypothetical protein